MKRSIVCSLLVASALACLPQARAALQEEVQVYTDDINAPGEKSLEVHVNTTPSSRNKAGYPGEAVNLHGLRVTPEFALGLTRTVEVGLYLPIVRESGGDLSLPGAKLRLKWLPILPQEQADGARIGWFAGTNFELARIAYRFEEARSKLEMRNIVGYRGQEWSFAMNPILRWGLTSGHRGETGFELDTRVMRSLSAHTQVGVELYDVVGAIGNAERWSKRDRRLFAVAEHEFESGFGLHFGLGRGFGSADKWTVKAIVSVPWR